MWLCSVLFQDMIIGGDLNAGCSYFGDSDKETNRLYNDPRFTWLIGDDANTNVASSECPYDRSNRISIASRNTKQLILGHLFYEKIVFSKKLCMLLNTFA